MTTTTAMRLAIRSIRRSPIRALLTGVGLLVGVLAITLTMASGEGARRAVTTQWKAMVGTLDLMFISPGGKAQRGMATMQDAITTLTPEDALAIQSEVPNVREVGIEQSMFGVTIDANGKNGVTTLFGVSPNWNRLRADSVARGRMLTEGDNQAMARVALLGADVARDFFPGMDPIGQRVRIDNTDFEIIGVLAPNGAGPGGASIDNLVYVPVQTTARRVFNRTYLSTIQLQLADPSRVDETERVVTTLLRSRHRLAPGQLDDFRILSPRAMLAQRGAADSAIRRTILLVGVLALVLGGVMVANLMYAAIADRASEIGIRRAVGATQSDIRRQFWIEAVGVAVLAGGVGVLLSLIAIAGGGRLLRYPLAVAWPVTGIAFGATVAIGLAAGFFPAHRAARLTPADVLRTQP